MSVSYRGPLSRPRTNAPCPISLDYRPESRASFKVFAILYTLTLFAAVAVVALALFIVGRFLTRAIKVWFLRDDA
jgi:hypothetical protein